MKPWLENQLRRVPPRGGLAEAIRYTLARWPAFCRFLDDGRVELDTNAVERAIRPVTLGRKNHLFSKPLQNVPSSAARASPKGNAIYITDIYRARLDYPAQRKAIERLAREHGARIILIEDAANGSPLVADLRRLGKPGVPTPIAIKPKGSKVERLSIQSSRIEAGDVRLPQSAPWLDAFNAEILAFPHGRHDDQVDALSQLMAWTGAQNRRGRISIHPPELIELEE